MATQSETVMDKWKHASDPSPHGEPVLAEYHPWNADTNDVEMHVVWWWEGEWRLYPQTQGVAFVERWRPFEHAEELREAVKRQNLRSEAPRFKVSLGDIPYGDANPEIDLEFQVLPDDVSELHFYIQGPAKGK